MPGPTTGLPWIRWIVAVNCGEFGNEASQPGSTSKAGDARRVYLRFVVACSRCRTILPALEEKAVELVLEQTEFFATRQAEAQ
jgi:hypothetical protein